MIPPERNLAPWVPGAPGSTAVGCLGGYRGRMQDPPMDAAEIKGLPPSDLSEPPPDLDRLAADLAVLAEIDDELGALDVALRRLDDGSSWTCEACGEPIDEVTLAGAPLGRRCRRCEP